MACKEKCVIDTSSRTPSPDSKNPKQALSYDNDDDTLSSQKQIKFFPIYGNEKSEKISLTSDSLAKIKEPSSNSSDKCSNFIECEQFSSSESDRVKYCNDNKRTIIDSFLKGSNEECDSCKRKFSSEAAYQSCNYNIKNKYSGHSECCGSSVKLIADGKETTCRYEEQDQGENASWSTSQTGNCGGTVQQPSRILKESKFPEDALKSVLLPGIVCVSEGVNLPISSLTAYSVGNKGSISNSEASKNEQVSVCKNIDDVKDCKQLGLKSQEHKKCEENLFGTILIDVLKLERKNASIETWPLSSKCTEVPNKWKIVNEFRSDSSLYNISQKEVSKIVNNFDMNARFSNFTLNNLKPTFSEDIFTLGTESKQQLSPSFPPPSVLTIDKLKKVDTCAVKEDETTGCAKNVDKGTDVKVSQNSDLIQTLPTICEKSTDCTETFDFDMEFNLQNSPMLRRSRVSHETPKRADCRLIFNSENINSQEKLSQGEQFTTLRDSLDIIKELNLLEVPSKSIKNSKAVDKKVPSYGKLSVPNSELSENKQGTISPQSKNVKSMTKKKTSFKSNKDSDRRRVSFPEDDSGLITSYLEPVNPWYHMDDVSTDIISEAYKKSCERHKTRVLPAILQQIVALPVGIGGRIECLNVKHCKLEAGQCECLEEIFRRVQFQTLDFEGCELDDDTAIPLFDMIEFYDSAIHLNISANTKIGSRGWQACARMMKRTQSLRILEARSTNLSEQNMPILCKALRVGTRLHTLHLENCNLTGRPLVNLAGALRLNDTITDLYLSDNRLGVNDCIQIGNLVRANKTLRLLDLRNNNIQDSGCAHICKDIAEQQAQQKDELGGSSSNLSGLTTLILWNNHITVHGTPYFSLMLHSNFSLETLNVGKNNLTSEGILLLKNSLIRNRTLKRLGLQATRIGNEGAVALAECIADNNTLSRLDLRENNIQVAGLLALCRSLKINSAIVQLDLDANPRAEPSSEMYNEHVSLHAEIKTLCQLNQTNAHLRESSVSNIDEKDEEEYHLCSPERRKISLTCETIGESFHKEKTPETSVMCEGKKYRSPEPSPSVSPCPSPSLSPSPSPVPSPLKNRFKVCKVSEVCNSLSSDINVPGVCSVTNVLSTSAPALFMHNPVSSSSTSVMPPRTSRFTSSSRFTVTKVHETSSSTPFKSSLPNNRAMSSPSLMNATELKVNNPPTIVVSSPNKAVHGFSVEGSKQESCAVNSYNPKEEGNYALKLPIAKTNSVLLEPLIQDKAFENDSNVSGNIQSDFSDAIPSPQEVALRAPLACMEPGSFDSDSEDSEVTTQSSDSTHSDEVRIATEHHVEPKPAWEDKGEISQFSGESSDINV